MLQHDVRKRSNFHLKVDLMENICFVNMLTDTSANGYESIVYTCLIWYDITYYDMIWHVVMLIWYIMHRLYDSWAPTCYLAAGCYGLRWAKWRTVFSGCISGGSPWAPPPFALPGLHAVSEQPFPGWAIAAGPQAGHEGPLRWRRTKPVFLITAAALDLWSCVPCCEMGRKRQNNSPGEPNQLDGSMEQYCGIVSRKPSQNDDKLDNKFT